MALGLIVLASCIAVYAFIGLLCGLFMLSLWWRFRKVGKRHSLWKTLWVGGWLVLVLGVSAWFLPNPWGLLFLIVYATPALWIVSSVLYRWAIFLN